MQHEIVVPAGAKTVIDRLSQNGFESYLVGGCVRDSLLGIQPKDWDICTSATPAEVMRCFSDFKIIETGMRHGTVTVIVNEEPFEVTTYRTDGAYTDHRRPDAVSFVSDIRADLARRDFTINAMAFHYERGLIDPFGGEQDLKDGVLSCVGVPDDRFREDALRILRALRFSAVYGFAISKETSDAIHRNAALLNHISAERINAELCRILRGKNVLRVLLDFSDVISTIIPEIRPCIGFDQHSRYHQYTVYDHIAHAIANYKGNDICVLVTLLLHDIGKPHCYTEDEQGGHFYGHGTVSYDIAKDVLRNLRFDQQTQNDVAELVLYHDETIEPTPRTIRKWLNKLGREQFMRLMDVRLADIQAHAAGTQESRIQRRDAAVSVAEDIIASQQCFSLKDLAINGNDVLALGIPEGRAIGAALKAALDGVLEGSLENDKSVLLAAIQRKYCEQQ